MTWTDQQQRAAQTEGWGVFFVVDSGKPLKTGREMILTTSDGFKNRLEATQYVVAAAKERSRLHIHALQCCAASAAKATAPTKKAPR